MLKKTWVVVVLCAACTAGVSPKSAPILEFRAAVIPEEDPPGEVGQLPRDCAARPLSSPRSFELPSGRALAIQLGDEPRYSVSMRRRDIAIRQVDSALVDGVSAYFVVLKLPETELRKAIRFRQEHHFCRFAVLVDDVIVGIDDPGSTWDSGVPAGMFGSMQDLLETYPSDAGWTISDRIRDDNTREKVFWEWRLKQDQWELYCDPSLREQTRLEAPELYEELLRNSPDINCSEPPPIPEVE
jgi:hypothetical protein